MIMFTSIVLSIILEFVKTQPGFVWFSLTNAIKKPLEIARGFLYDTTMLFYGNIGDIGWS